MQMEWKTREGTTLSPKARENLFNIGAMAATLIERGEIALPDDVGWSELWVWAEEKAEEFEGSYREADFERAGGYYPVIDGFARRELLKAFGVNGVYTEGVL